MENNEKINGNINEDVDVEKVGENKIDAVIDDDYKVNNAEAVKKVEKVMSEEMEEENQKNHQKYGSNSEKITSEIQRLKKSVKDKNDSKLEENAIRWLPICCLGGFSLGIMLSNVFDFSMVKGVSVGFLVGLIVGAGVDMYIDKANKAAEEKRKMLKEKCADTKQTSKNKE